MGKSTISMAIFNCYVSSPEGNPHFSIHFSMISRDGQWRRKAPRVASAVVAPAAGPFGPVVGPVVGPAAIGAGGPGLPHGSRMKLQGAAPVRNRYPLVMTNIAIENHHF